MNTYPQLDSQRTVPANQTATKVKTVTPVPAIHESEVVQAWNRGEKVTISREEAKTIRKNGFEFDPNFIEVESDHASRHHNSKDEQNVGGYALSKDGRLQLAVELAPDVQVNTKYIVDPREEHVHHAHHHVHHEYQAQAQGDVKHHAFVPDTAQVKVSSQPSEKIEPKPVVENKANVVAQNDTKVADTSQANKEVVKSGPAENVEQKKTGPSNGRVVAEVVYGAKELKGLNLANNVAEIDAIAGPAHASAEELRRRAEQAELASLSAPHASATNKADLAAYQSQGHSLKGAAEELSKTVAAVGESVDSSMGEITTAHATYERNQQNHAFKEAMKEGMKEDIAAHQDKDWLFDPNHKDRVFQWDSGVYAKYKASISNHESASLHQDNDHHSKDEHHEDMKGLS